jgi:hypothetical protein
VSPQRELSRIFPSVALYFHPPVDLHRVSSKRTITDFALNGFVFSSLSGFTLCLFRENYHGFYPQWPFHFHPSVDLYRVSLERCFTDFAPSGFAFLSLREFTPCFLRENYHGFFPQWPFHFHPSVDLYPVSSERIFTDFALSGFAFLSLKGFTQCLLRENYHRLCP